jgi:hypothetical protein
VSAINGPDELLEETLLNFSEPSDLANWWRLTIELNRNDA